MPEKMPYQPSPEEEADAVSRMSPIEMMNSRFREKAAKEGEYITINPEKEGDKIKIQGQEIFVGNYMTITGTGKKQWEEQPISPKDALQILEFNETSIQSDIEKLRDAIDNIGILKNRILEMQAKQEEKEN